MSYAGGIILAAALSAFAGWCFVRQLCRERPRPPLTSYDLSPWGEVIQFPHEWRPVRKSGGGGTSEQHERADTQTVIAHDGMANT